MASTIVSGSRVILNGDREGSNRAGVAKAEGGPSHAGLSSGGARDFDGNRCAVASVDGREGTDWAAPRPVFCGKPRPFRSPFVYHLGSSAGSRRPIADRESHRGARPHDDGPPVVPPFGPEQARIPARHAHRAGRV